MRMSTRMALIGLPVLLAVAAGGSAISAAAKAPAASPARAAAVVDISKAGSVPGVTTKTPSTTELATPEKETPESGTAASATANEPAGGGHTDEAAGATTESNVDHQFDGNE